MNDYPIYVLCDEVGNIIDVAYDHLEDVSRFWCKHHNYKDPLFIHEAYATEEPIAILKNGVCETIWEDSQ